MQLALCDPCSYKHTFLASSLPRRLGTCLGLDTYSSGLGHLFRLAVSDRDNGDSDMRFEIRHHCKAGKTRPAVIEAAAVEIVVAMAAEQDSQTMAYMWRRYYWCSNFLGSICSMLADNDSALGPSADWAGKRL